MRRSVFPELTQPWYNHNDKYMVLFSSDGCFSPCLAPCLVPRVISKMTSADKISTLESTHTCLLASSSEPHFAHVLVLYKVCKRVSEAVVGLGTGPWEVN